MTSQPTTPPTPHRRPLLRLLATAAFAALVALQLTGGPSTALGASSPTPSPSPTTGHPSGTAPAPNHATFGIGPARHGKPDPLRPYLNYLAGAGAHFSDQVIVVNLSRFPIDLNVYAADAVTASNGDFTLLAQATRPKDAGAWISVRATHGSRVTVAARSSVVLPVRMHIPKNATPGDHAAGVIASYTSISKDSKGANVRLVQRVGLRVFFRVEGPLHPLLSVERLRTHYVNNWNPIGGGAAVVTYRVSNTGNVKLGAQQRISIHGLLGPTAHAAPETLPLLLPGSHVDVRVVVPGVAPALWVTASVHLTPVVPGDTDTGLRVWSGSSSFWAVPWIWLAVFVVAVAAGVFWWWRRRRRRPAGVKRSKRRWRRRPPPVRTEQAPLAPANHRADKQAANHRSDKQSANHRADKQLVGRHHRR